MNPLIRPAHLPCSSAQVTWTSIHSPQKCSRSARAFFWVLRHASRRQKRGPEICPRHPLFGVLRYSGWCCRWGRRLDLRDPLLCTFAALGKLLLSGGQLRPDLIARPNRAALLIPSRSEPFLQGSYVLLKTGPFGQELVTFGLGATNLPDELVLNRG